MLAALGMLLWLGLPSGPHQTALTLLPALLAVAGARAPISPATTSARGAPVPLRRGSGSAGSLRDRGLHDGCLRCHLHARKRYVPDRGGLAGVYESQIGPKIKELGFSPEDVRWVSMTRLDTDYATARAGSWICSCPSCWSDPPPIHCWAIEHDSSARPISGRDEMSLPVRRANVQSPMSRRIRERSPHLSNANQSYLRCKSVLRGIVTLARKHSHRPSILHSVVARDGPNRANNPSCQPSLALGGGDGRECGRGGANGLAQVT